MRKHATAFTIIELLCAMAVLLLLLTGLLQVVSHVSGTASQQARRTQSIGEARAALDTLGQDLSVLVRNEEATILFKPGNTSENDELKFLCLSRPAPGVDAPRMSLISYRIEQRTDTVFGDITPVLVRGDSVIRWAQPNERAADDYDFETVLGRSTETDSPVALGVFRFEVLWFLKNGEVRHTPPLLDGETPDGFVRVDLSQVGGVIASVACLDRPSLPIAARSGWPSIQAALPSTPSGSANVESSTLATWQNTLPAIEPPRVRQNVRFVERTCPLP